jgi:hypothetical protein
MKKKRNKVEPGYLVSTMAPARWGRFCGVISGIVSVAVHQKTGKPLYRDMQLEE